MRLSLAVAITSLFLFGLNYLSLRTLPALGKSAAEIQAENLARENRRRTGAEIATWENLATAHPGFRDIFLKLAVLNWQIGNNTKASNYFSEAAYLDPNNETMEKTRILISNPN